MNNRKIVALMILFGSLPPGIANADIDLPSKFTNRDTIRNTRHNLTQRQESGGPNGSMMDPSRNDYAQVCVYCHTPHGANKNVQGAPLWNRTARTTTYTLYNQQSLSQDATQPGPNSLTCLSCHDGQTAVDSIVNMPGSGGYNSELLLDPSTTTTNTLLNAWTNPRGTDATAHGRLATGTSCLACHAPYNNPSAPEDEPQKAGATDFSAFALGTDLSNDHPVGVKLPVGSDWKVPGGTRANIKYFDDDASGSMGKEEIRFYDSGGGYEVECASCHDPHGVPGVGGTFNPTFLRKTNDGSAVCLSCHTK